MNAPAGQTRRAVFLVVCEHDALRIVMLKQETSLSQKVGRPILGVNTQSDVSGICADNDFFLANVTCSNSGPKK